MATDWLIKYNRGIRQEYKREVDKALNRLQAERADIQEEYQRVSEIYLRHLERINKKAARNRGAMEAITRWVRRDAPKLPGDDGRPIG